MKKVGMFLVGLVVLCALTIAAIPMFYDVNAKVKPMIQQAISENLNAKAEIGKLKLSLWGKISIGIESLIIQETVMNTKVFQLKDASLDIPLSSLLKGKVHVVLSATQPEIFVVKNQAKDMNILKMVKPSSVQEKAPEASSGVQPGEAGSKAASRLRLGLNITNAKLTFDDQSTKTQSYLENLNLNFSEVGVNSPLEFLIATSLKVKQGVDLEMTGPIQMIGKSKIGFGVSGLETTTFDTKLSLDDLAIRYGELFNKQGKSPLNIEMQGTYEPAQGSLDLKSRLIVNDFKLQTDMIVENFDNPKVDLTLKSDKLMLENWQKIIAPVGKFGMTGAASMNMKVNYSEGVPTYNGQIELSGASLKAPGLVPPVTDLKSKLLIKTDYVQMTQTSMMIGESDIGVSGEVKNFKSPVIKVEASSRLMNVDEMLGLSPVGEPEKAATKAPEKTDQEIDREVEAMAQGPIDILKKNPVMRNLVFQSQTKITKLIMKKIEMTNVSAVVDFEKLVLSMKDARLGIFGGQASSKISVDFNGKDPTYKIGGAIKDLDMDQALAHQFADLKGFLGGKTSANFDVAGSGVVPSKVKMNLTGQGQFDLKDGTWSALSVLQKLGEKLQQIPGAKEKLGGARVGNKFKTLGGKFTIGNGQLNLINVTMELSEGNTGLVVNGKVSFNKTMELTGKLMLTANDVPKKLIGPDGRAHIPFELRGPLMSPEVVWEKTLTPVATAYGEHEAKKALGKAAEQGLQKLKENIKDENIKKVLENQNAQDLLKKIGF